MAQIDPIDKSYCLEQLCAANFLGLLKLIPDLLGYRISATGRSPSYASLYLNVLERSPHTMTVQLTYRFNRNLNESAEPAVKIRLYLDAKLAEVLSDHAREPVAQVYRDPGSLRQIVDYKWRLNYFLHKWLEHCLNKDYSFNQEMHQAVEAETA